MAKIERKNQKIFALNSTDNGQFGSARAGTLVTDNDPDVIQALTAWGQGWNNATISGERLPTLEEIQGIQYVLSRQIAYGFQEGIPEYNSDTVYYENSLVKESGTVKIYKSLSDDNQGNPLTGSSDPEWEMVVNLDDIPQNLLPLNNTWTGTNVFQETVDVTNVNAETSSGGNLRTNSGVNCFSWGGGGSANSTLGGNMSGAGTYKLVNMIDPTSDQDYATKIYVDQPKILHIQDQKSSGTLGGSSVIGWQTRTLNTVVTNEITGSSLSSNQITLPAGKYWVYATSSYVGGNGKRLKIYNVTDSSDIIQGSNSYSETFGSIVSLNVILSGYFEIASQKDIDLRMYSEAARATNGLGQDVTSGDNEVYSEILIRKLN